MTAEAALPLSAAAATSPRGTRTVGWRVATRVELAKLRAQARVRIVLAACVITPFIVVLAVKVSGTLPMDDLFGRWMLETGWATPLLMVGFTGQWVLPIITCVVAGDIFAAEDHHRTWTTMLTRSCSRANVFVAKAASAAVFAVVATVVLAVASVLAGIAVVGTQPLTDLTGHLMPSSTALVAVAEAWATALPPVLAVTGFGLLASVASRNSWVGVVVPVLILMVSQLVGMLSAIDPIRPFLPSTGFDAWHGLVRSGIYLGPVWQSLAVSAGWALITVSAAAIVLRRRDVVDS